MKGRQSFLIISFGLMLVALLGALLFGGGKADPTAPIAGTPATGDPAESGRSELATGRLAGGAVDEGGNGPDRTAVESGPAATGRELAARIRITGRLVEAGGGVAGCELTYRPPARFDTLALPMWGLDEAGTRDVALLTDADGRFELDVEPGDLGLLILPRAANRLFVDGGQRRAELAAAEQPTDLGEFVVQTAASVLGRVVDESGTPIPTARVRANPTEMLTWRPGDGVQVDAEGRFSITGLTAAEHRVHASAPGFVPSTHPLELRTGQPVDGVVLKLRRGQSIAGTVVDDRGRPIAGARVAGFRARTVAPEVEVRTADDAEAVTTDSNGYFVLSGLETNAATLRVRANEHATELVPDVTAGTGNLVVRLTRLGSIAGILVDRDGRGIAGSRVMARSAESVGNGLDLRDLADIGAMATTDGDGRFQVDGVRPGSVRLIATGATHLRVDGLTFQVHAGETLTDVRLVADTGAAVDVLVVDPDGVAVAGAEVEVREPGRPEQSGRAFRVRARGNPDGDEVRDLMGGGQVHGHATTDEHGRARIPGLAAGAVEVTARHADFAAARPTPLTLPRSGVVESVLTLRPAGYLSITTLAPDRTPLPEQSFVVRAAVGGDRQDGKTDAAGVARIGPLAEGVYTVVMTMPPRPTQLGGGMNFVIGDSTGDELPTSSREVQVRAGDDIEVELIKPVLTRVFGTVLDAAGPVVGVQVEFHDPAAPPFGAARSSASDADGQYSIADVPPGTYAIEWSRPGRLVPHREQFEVPAGAPEMRRDLLLSGGVVRVTVLDVDGMPLERADVRLTRAGVAGAPVQRARGMIMMSARAGPGEDSAPTTVTVGDGRVRTDEDGMATIEDVPPGNYVLSIEHRRHASERKDVSVVDGKTTDVGAVQMTGAGQIRGAVVGLSADSLGGMAIVEYRSVGDPAAEPRTEIAQGGAFEIGSLAAGEYELRARELGPDRPEVLGPAVRVTVRAGATERVELSVK